MSAAHSFGISGLAVCRLIPRRLFLLASLLFLASAPLAQTFSQGRVLEKTSLNMYPSREAPEQLDLAIGTTVQILGYRIDRELAEWWQVELPASGITGFVPAAVMEAVETVTPVPPVETSPAVGSAGRFAQMMGVGTAPDQESAASGGQSVFSQLARSGEIEQGRERTRQQELEEELKRQEEALLAMERREQQRLAAEEQRLRQRGEALQRNRNVGSGGSSAPSGNTNLAGSLAETIQQGFQDLTELRISTHEETMRNLELARQNEENRRRQQEQQQRQHQQQQDRQNRQSQQIEQERQRLAQQRQQREQELARQRAAIEAQRNQISQQRTPVAAPVSPPAAISFGGSSPPEQSSRPLRGNPGRSAPDCIRMTHEAVDFRDDAYHVIFSNTCDTPVFVMWCGNAPYSLNCGENFSNYYASTANLRPGWQHRALIHDRIFWGACEGSIGFGQVDFFSDYDNGDYSCLPTGDYALAQQAAPRRISPYSHQRR